MSDLAIYLGSRRYVVRPYDSSNDLWACLADTYTREDAQRLADSLNQEREAGRRRHGARQTSAPD